MVNFKKIFPDTLNVNFNLLLPSLLIIALVSNYWLSQLEIKAGKTYYEMIVVVIGIIVIGLITFKIKDLGEITKFIRVPFGISLGLSTTLYLFGWIFAVLFQLIISTFSKFSIASLSIPLYGSNIITGITQSYSTAEFESSMVGKLIVVVFDAGTVEEFAFSWGILIGCAIIGLLIVSYLNRGNRQTIKNDKRFILLFSIIVSTLLFMGAHTLNGTYDTWYMYLVAGAFKLISLLTIYYFGIIIMFWLGYHSANNLIYLINTEGGVNVINGFLSWFGIIFFTILLLMIWYLISNLKKSKEEFINYLRNLRS